MSLTPPRHGPPARGTAAAVQPAWMTRAAAVTPSQVGGTQCAAQLQGQEPAAVAPWLDDVMQRAARLVAEQ
eukprot:4030532-Karenia_brevis.AAC.1